MKPYQYIEQYFWVFMLAGLVLGLSIPVYNDQFMVLLEPLLMIMLFTVFLKSDLVHILVEIKNYKLMLYLVSAYMIIIPVIFYFTINLFDQKLAIGILLLTAMPAAVAAPALADIVKGNTVLATSITIVTSIIAPFTIPLIFRFLNFEQLSIDPWHIFRDLTIIVFVPMIISQIVRKYIPKTVQKRKILFTPINILILSFMVYIVLGSQRNVVINQTSEVVLQLAFLYFIFILLHVVGYMLGYKHGKQNKISITIGAAYMNNGLAIVLAAKYFDPSILVLMVLTELPWNTLLAPFKKIVNL